MLPVFDFSRFIGEADGLEFLLQDGEESDDVLWVQQRLGKVQSLLSDINILVLKDLSDINELFLKKLGIDLSDIVKLVQDNKLDIIIRVATNKLDVNVDSKLDSSRSSTDLSKSIGTFEQDFMVN